MEPIEYDVVELFCKAGWGGVGGPPLIPELVFSKKNHKFGEAVPFIP